MDGGACEGQEEGKLKGMGISIVSYPFLWFGSGSNGVSAALLTSTMTKM